MTRYGRSTLLAGLALVATAATLEAQAPAAAAAPAAAQPAPRAARQSWTSDRRSFRQGDVITVLIDEHTLAAALKGTSSSASRTRDLTLGVDQTVAPTLPGIGAELSSGSAAEQRSRGDLTRENRFQAEMTVRVVGVEPNGLLKVEGKKVINVERNSEELTLTAFVRPQDVSQANLVESWRLADAELLYSTRGSLGNPKSGIVSRILGAVWP